MGKNVHIFKTVVEPHPDMNFNQNSLKKLLNGSSQSVRGWKLADPPPNVHTLIDGTKLASVRLPRRPCPLPASIPARPPTCETPVEARFCRRRRN
mmetsp:Transcript_34476/g.73562  ORF Transcript_34476/g.73562 Transcript_34476/m.73562 type:complete len:95 (-) Transcript_34476:190-474(-)